MVKQDQTTGSGHQLQRMAQGSLLDHRSLAEPGTVQAVVLAAQLEQSQMMEKLELAFEEMKREKSA